MDIAALVALRRDLHQHPELGYQEHRTSGLVAEFLARLGLEVYQGIGKTGVVGVLKRGTSPRAVGLRADMDALPMADNGTQPWKSQQPNVCHACGHDGHTVMLLGAAQALAADAQFDGTVNFIFQPAEEGLAGAQAMIDDGLFERFPCDEVYAIHNWPQLPLGVVQTRPGPIMGAGDAFSIRVEGGGGHAAQPQLTPDTLLATSELVVALHTIVSRDLDPCDPAVLTVTRINGGFSHNMIPAQATLSGTVRSFDSAVQDRIEQRMRELAQHVTAAHGLTAAVQYDRYYPATINGAEQAATALRAAARAGLAHAEAPKPALTSEDFSFMLQAKPGAYLWLGSADSRPLHHSEYDFNDALIPFGIRWYCALVQETLGPEI
ncbi:peptidase M20 [bacteria symbiont BFo1 of Frankliniella occidentalis]|nr:M20 aminoacylase family protein [Erwinia aphidicola]KMV71250.1 peptidase M20 [bacteria symbiont BFo1 of Frankliniella occidentalis]PIJ55429.1 peptidase M20 [Erwinia sp. OLMDLW33]KYP84527.1 peptidase M20 [bacteria symbiont BFo1 of Frankliniella occidentalis]KYP89709.1 peptidase M20 [bacteria symbiont BFo1 of Frankliniella occidentalis]MCP2233878.1 hippurate hydrolase [Erwinia aphidicola]